MGTTILTEATPSAPTPRPINTPSIAVIADIDIVPRIVGINNFLNSLEMFSVSKSIASRFIFILYLSQNRIRISERTQHLIRL